jgi:hypothetical protein
MADFLCHENTPSIQPDRETQKSTENNFNRKDSKENTSKVRKGGNRIFT